MEDQSINLRLEAIKDFINDKRDNYLRIVRRTEEMIEAALGSSYSKASYAEDVIQDVFCDLIEGRRKWDMEKYLPEQVIIMDIKSELSNFVKKEMKYVITNTWGVKNQYNDEDEYYDNEMDTLINTQPEDVEGKMDADSMLNYCYEKILNNDEDGSIVLSEMIEGKTQKQIAKYLGLEVSEVHADIKRIRRNIRNNLPAVMLQNVPANYISNLRKKK